MRAGTPSLIVKKPSIMTTIYLLPPILKLTIAVAVFFLIIFIGFFHFKSNAVNESIFLNAQKNLLQDEVIKKASMYGQLEFVSKGIAEDKQKLNNLIEQFPTESQIGDLLSDITKIGTKDGLKFVSFKPLKPVKYNFYAKADVDIVVIGQFHQVALFLSDLANLPNSIVSVDNFTLKRADPTKNDAVLSLQFVATLYYVLPNSAEIKI